MSRRYVKKTQFDSLDQVKPVIKSVVSAKDNLESTSKGQTYFKRNYLDAIKQIIPKFYFSDERTVSGTHISFVDQLINSQIIANKNQETLKDGKHAFNVARSLGMTEAGYGTYHG